MNNKIHSISEIMEPSHLKTIEKNKSLAALKEEIESELYTLSKAHYEKYFIEPLNRNKSM